MCLKRLEEGGVRSITTTLGTTLKGHRFRQVENHSFRLRVTNLFFVNGPTYDILLQNHELRQ